MVLYLKAAIQLALLFTVFFLLLIQYGSQADYSKTGIKNGNYISFEPSYTEEPEPLPVTSSHRSVSNKRDKLTPLFGFIPRYVAIMSFVIVFVISGGFLLMYLRVSGLLR
ncbi:MAG: hypothetical protein GX157_08270 [Candidatus Cloacimonetes bacterium]|jgi:hypothetical protein|nr:hypothetical protein [Candidatus Cloacimonadota bacterium]